LPNLRPPLALDARDAPWPVDRADAILCINMIHISPPSATAGLLAEAGRLLPPGAPLILYGPFLRPGIETAPSNIAFDADLRRRDPRWGLRDLDTLIGQARGSGLSFDRLIEMPANNLAVILRHD
jgi:SAM-dependent methyltransferase